MGTAPYVCLAAAYHSIEEHFFGFGDDAALDVGRVDFCQQQAELVQAVTKRNTSECTSQGSRS